MSSCRVRRKFLTCTSRRLQGGSRRRGARGHSISKHLYTTTRARPRSTPQSPLKLQIEPDTPLHLKVSWLTSTRFDVEITGPLVFESSLPRSRS